jgi:hypothetical protein
MFTVFRRMALIPMLLMLGTAVRPAAAQVAPSPSRPKHWGVTASFAPWHATDSFKRLYDATSLDMTGKNMRVGVTRGLTLGSEFSITYIRRDISEGATLVDLYGVKYVFQQGITLKGFMVEQYGAITTMGNRAQIGVVIAGGLARAEGVAQSSYGGAPLTPREAREVLTLFARQVDLQLLLRAEIAAAFKLAPGLKLRLGGGFDWPGTTAISVTLLYFIGESGRP